MYKIVYNIFLTLLKNNIEIFLNIKIYLIILYEQQN